MKTHFRAEIRNYSRYPIDLVWENAKDLEHVAFLHSRTNKEFHLLFAGKLSEREHEYDMLVYRTRRRFHFLSFETFGFRKIVDRYNIHQLEYIPLLGITSSLNSLLFKNESAEFPTVMVDEVVWEVPKIYAPLKNYLIGALRRHTKIQCQEDEPFRARRQELEQRGIRLPLSIFNRSKLDELSGLFQLSLSTSRQKPFAEPHASF